MKTYAGGREIEIPTDPDGCVDIPSLRRAIGTKRNRPLIQQEPTGENFVLPTSGKVRLSPFSRFLDTPRTIRG